MILEKPNSRVALFFAKTEQEEPAKADLIIPL